MATATEETTTTDEAKAAADAAAKAENKAADAAKAKDNDGGARYTQDYVDKLRKEAAENRTRAKELQDKIDAENEAKLKQDKEYEKLANESKKKQVAAEERAAEVERKAAMRIIKAEVRSAAVAAGLEDLDDVALIDFSSLADLTDDDEIAAGAVALVAKFKEAKPRKFKDSTKEETKAQGEDKPKPKTTPQTNKDAKSSPKSAREMTKEEFDAAWARA